MRKSFISFFLLGIISLFMAACKKEAGEGGTSSIKGNVWARFHDKNAGYNVINSYKGTDIDVYIVYGDEVSYGDRIKTDYEGDFEFKYLRNGKYKVYVYSEDSAAIVATNPLNLNAPLKAVIAEVEVSGKKTTVDAGTLTILTH